LIINSFFFLFREFRNAFFEILHYNNCKCCPKSSGDKVRTSISKSNHSMNTKLTPPNQSRQASVIPISNPSQRNGRLSYETSPSLSTPLPKKIHYITKHDSTDTFEMQMLTHQRKTLDAFHELEHLIPNGVPSRASFNEINSINQDDPIIEIPQQTSNSNHS
jgi:hypothetical protein